MATGGPGTGGELAVEVRGLKKSYGSVEAVRGVDIQIRKGEIFALLGPNGAGKTTTVEILEGYRERDAGDVSVLGFDPAKHARQLHSRIGIVLQSTGIDHYLTVAETITMYSSYYPHPRPVDEVIQLVGLEEKRDSRVQKLSGGQQRRLDVAIALAGDPDLLFLDEPTTGFDPSARREAWDVVKNLAELGKTVLLTTHFMDEAQYLADEVAVISGGVIVAEGDPATIAGRNLARPVVRFQVAGDTTLPSDLGITRDGTSVELSPPDLTAGLHRLTGWALEQGVELEGLEIVRPSLEDTYLKLTTSDEHDGAPAGGTRSRRLGRGRRATGDATSDGAGR
jgi:ABC-2 type transport system ATP-binding protein